MASGISVCDRPDITPAAGHLRTAIGIRSLTPPHAASRGATAQAAAIAVHVCSASSPADVGGSQLHMEAVRPLTIRARATVHRRTRTTRKDDRPRVQREVSRLSRPQAQAAEDGVPPTDVALS